MKVGEIRTFTGRYIDVFNPNPDSIVIEDIAHALSQMPRFGGHLPDFYSVAEHCLNGLVHITGNNLLLAWLMHDSTEGYLMDLPKPIKMSVPEYQEIEHNLMLVISKKFGFKYPFDNEIKKVDELMLEIEMKELRIAGYPKKHLIESIPIKQAEARFLSMYRYLTK